MAKPHIFAVDDDPEVLAAISRDLRRQYGEDYRVVRAGSGAEALEATQSLKGRGETVALFVVDQRMPNMTGTEFLVSASPLFPEAKTVLLTAYADTEAAITAINEVGLDHYLMKPWDPPEENLYPVLDELVDDWRANTPAPYDGIRVVGDRWSPATHDVKDFLARNQIPYRFLDVERDAEARAMVEAASEGAPRLPIVFLPDGTSIAQPDHRALAAEVGLQTEAKQPFYDLIVVGAGPAGLGAAVYAASEGLRTAVIEREATGGQAGTSSRIENYLGFPAGISGSDLARRAAAQARKFGAEILTAVEADKVVVQDPVKIVTLDNGTELASHALFIASGMTIRHLKAPGVDRLLGAGIYYGAAPSEASTYDGEDVFVVGGANSAGQASMMLSRYAGSVTMIVRGDSLEARMSQYLVDQINAVPNISVVLNSRVKEVDGGDRLEEVVLENIVDETEKRLEASGLFIFIGAVPHSDFVSDVVERNDRGFIITGPDLMVDGKWPRSWTLNRDPFLLETSSPGIFAAGDVRAGVVRRVASAVGQGAVGVSFVHKYLETV